jgi:ribose 5-phosphate isomerase B
MKIVVASDEKTDLTDRVVDYLKSIGHELTLIGHLTDKNQKWHWADIGKKAAKTVVKDADYGILFCWSGTGICIAANKVKGARAALCWNIEIAQLARKWDDANILCLSLKETKPDDAQEMVDAFLSTKFDEEDLNQAHTLDN